MKISRLQVDNFLGVRSVDAVLNAPVALFCGANAAGKSSIQEAVRMAITGDVVRVSLKKNYGQLVADGTKAGGALVTTAGGTYAFDVPGGKVTADEGLPHGESIDISLNGQRFASMSADDKRTFLFGLTGCRATGPDVKDRMVKRKCDEAKIDAILPMLRSGFPAAHDQAAENAKQSKRDWRAETGATWGDKVADRWKAPMPAPVGDIVAKPDDLVALDTEIAALNQQIGAAAAATRAASEAVAKREALKTKAESVARVSENLELKRIELAQYEQKVVEMRQRAIGGRPVGLVHDLAYSLEAIVFRTAKLIDTEDKVIVSAIATLDAYENEHGEITSGEVDQDAKASLPEYERGLEVMQNAVKNLERDLETAKAAKAAYDALQPSDSKPSTAGDIDALQARLASLKASRDKLQADIRAVEQYDAAVKAAEAKTAKAAAFHADVMAWLAIADALAPDGIPGDLLADALKPVNSTLQMAGIDTGWPQVFISQDMEITAGNRAYALLSESEKWRVDAMIAQAVAKISGIKILMLDRMDVLDLKGRGELLGWLDQLVEDGHIETALLFATLKAMPSGLPPTMQAFWLEGGSVVEYKAAA